MRWNLAPPSAICTGWASHLVFPDGHGVHVRRVCEELQFGDFVFDEGDANGLHDAIDVLRLGLVTPVIEVVTLWSLRHRVNVKRVN